MKLNIVVWNHKYGSDAWPVFANSKPKIGETHLEAWVLEPYQEFWILVV